MESKQTYELAMSMSWRSQELPFLPGYTFRDVTKSAFHLSQTLVYKNGFALALRPKVGIGREPLLSEQLIQQEISELSSKTPDLTNGFNDQSQVKEFIPAYVALDKKILCFYAYFKENVLHSSEEDYRVRPVVIYYYLKDDTMCIIEPIVENSGLQQGKRVKRQRLPKNEFGEHYNWKDLNLSMDLEVYGIKYHITHCDAFTKKFMESEGIALNDPQSMPVDPYTEHRKKPPPSFTTPSQHPNRLHQFLPMDGKVLNFLALWDDSGSLNGDTRRFIIQYFLGDDTVKIIEAHESDSDHNPVPVLMRRLRLPKTMKAKAENFPSCVLEVSADEVEEYYSPKDFQLGQTITLLGRCFLLCDCDGFTKEYYQKVHPDIEMKPIEMPKKTDMTQERKLEVPPYNGFGSLEDSLQNCLSLIPKCAKKNARKMLDNSNIVLHYRARLDSQNPVDEGRSFILSYFLSDDTISIFEKQSSDFIGGKFLKKTRVLKPGCTMENPEYYSPADFAIGATVEIFKRRFVLTDANHYVLTYLESISSQIPNQTLVSLRQKLLETDNQPADQNGENVGEPTS